MQRKPKIFLSHAYLDRNPVKQRLIADLEALNEVELWRAESEIVTGDSTFKAISDAISNSDYFIQILSDKKGAFRNSELELAFASETAKQDFKVIKAIVSGNEAGSVLLGRGTRGVVINFATNYEEAFSFLCSLIILEPSESIVQFDLDTFSTEKPIIVLSYEVNEKMIDYFSKNPTALKTMDRRLFEEFVAELFWGFGYQVELTKKTRDGGRDIIAINNSETAVKYLIECKRPDPGNAVGIKPVRELFGVKSDEKASKAILATTSYFSKDAMQFFERNKWELEPKDYNGILDWIKLYRQKKKIA